MSLIKVNFTFVPGGSTFTAMVPEGTTVQEALNAAGKSGAGYTVSINNGPGSLGSELNVSSEVVLSQKVVAG